MAEKMKRIFSIVGSILFNCSPTRGICHTLSLQTAGGQFKQCELSGLKLREYVLTSGRNSYF